MFEGKSDNGVRVQDTVPYEKPDGDSCDAREKLTKEECMSLDGKKTSSGKTLIWQKETDEDSAPSGCHVKEYADGKSCHDSKNRRDPNCKTYVYWNTKENMKCGTWGRSCMCKKDNKEIQVQRCANACRTFLKSSGPAPTVISEGNCKAYATFKKYEYKKLDERDPTMPLRCVLTNMDHTMDDGTTQNLETVVYNPPPTAVDCVGAFGKCASNCRKTYSITKQAQNGGKACPHKEGDTKSCTGGDCPKGMQSVSYVEAAPRTDFENYVGLASTRKALLSSSNDVPCSDEHRCVVNFNKDQVTNVGIKGFILMTPKKQRRK